MGASDGERTAPDYDQVVRSLRLIQARGKDTDLPDLRIPDNIRREPELLAAAEAATFGKWKRYEDEYVTFEYPEHPGITLEVTGPDKAFAVAGGPVGTTENTWFRNYLLKLGEASYCAMMLDKQPDFDDGTCFCGAVVLNRYLFRSGALYRFSLLEDGQVKKAQVLCKGLRLELFEWTHMPVHQDVYVRIALSVRMKNGPCDEPAMRRRILAKYGAVGRLGFLELGMRKVDVLRLLGEPTREDGERLTFTSLDGGWETTTRIDLPGGVFRGLGDGWRTDRQLPPARGTPEWIGEMSGRWHNDGYELGERTKEDVQFMFDRFVELAPTARGSDWVFLCGAMYALGLEGTRDPRIYPIVAGRFLDTTLDQGDAAELLHQYDPNASRPLLVKLVELIYAEAKPPPKPESRLGDWREAGLSLSTLYRLLSEVAPEYPRLVLAGMEHRDDWVRSRAFDQWESSPPSAELLALLRKGLSDSNRIVRDESAQAFARKYGEKEDVLLLQDRFEEEKDPDVRQDIRKAIDRLRRVYGAD